MGTLHKIKEGAKKATGKRKKKPAYELRLFTTGSTPRSTSAIQNLRAICDAALEGNYQLEVVDIYQQPGRASEADIIAAPTLIKYAPSPIRRIIGDLSDHAKVVSSLALKGNRK